MGANTVKRRKLTSRARQRYDERPIGRNGDVSAPKIQAIRGVKDILPGEMPSWQVLESTARTLLATFGYAEIKIPIFEASELFARGLGATTDVVEKEMYTFPDLDGKSLTLRPEGTAGALRASNEHHPWPQPPLTKLYYAA